MALRYPGVMPIPQVNNASDPFKSFIGGFEYGEKRKNTRQALDQMEQLYRSGLGQKPSQVTTPAMAVAAPQTQNAPVGQSVAKAAGNPGSIFDDFMGTVRGQVTNPFGLAAIASTGKAESGFTDKNARSFWSDPSESGQRGIAGGVMSWRGPRYAAMRRFAKANGGDLSGKTQAAFFLQEDPELIERLNAAGSLEEAQEAINNAWRFAGYDRNSPEVARRLDYARQYLPQFQGDQGQQAIAANLATPDSGNAGGQQIGQLAALALGAVGQPNMPKPTPEQFRTLMKSDMTRDFALKLWETNATGSQKAAREAFDLAMKLDERNYGRQRDAIKDRRADRAFEIQQANANKAPNSVREYEFYQQGEIAAGREPLSYADFKKLGRSSTTVNVNGEPNDANLRKSLDKKTGEVWSEYLQQGSQSAALSQDFEVLDQLIGMAPQGPLQGRLAEAFPGFSSAGDAFQSIVKRIAPTMRAPGSGSTSDIEYDGMLRSLPALRNAPEANAAIASIMKAKAALNMERSEIVSAYSRGEISRGEASAKIHQIDKRSIMTPAMTNALKAINAAAKTPELPKPGEERNGFVFKGGDPAERSNWEPVY